MRNHVGRVPQGLGPARRQRPLLRGPGRAPTLPGLGLGVGVRVGLGLVTPTTFLRGAGNLVRVIGLELGLGFGLGLRLGTPTTSPLFARRGGIGASVRGPSRPPSSATLPSARASPSSAAAPTPSCARFWVIGLGLRLGLGNRTPEPSPNSHPNPNLNSNRDQVYEMHIQSGADLTSPSGAA